LPWPTAEQVRNANDLSNHALLGIALFGCWDFLDACGWPDAYERSLEDVRRNGELVRGQEIRYDLASYIRHFMAEKGYNQFSVLEVMKAAGHPWVGRAEALLSHVQSERVSQTLKLLKNVGFSKRCLIDYFSFRQCITDFVPDRIDDAIGQIGETVLGLSQSPDGNTLLFDRVWCVQCTIKNRCEMQVVDDTVKGPLKLSSSAISASTNVREMKASKPSDKEQILQCRQDLPGGIEAVNKQTGSVVRNMQQQLLLKTVCHLGILACCGSTAFAVSYKLAPRGWQCLVVGSVQLVVTIAASYYALWRQNEEILVPWYVDMMVLFAPVGAATSLAMVEWSMMSPAAAVLIWCLMNSLRIGVLLQAGNLVTLEAARGDKQLEPCVGRSATVTEDEMHSKPPSVEVRFDHDARVMTAHPAQIKMRRATSTDYQASRAVPSAGSEALRAPLLASSV